MGKTCGTHPIYYQLVLSPVISCTRNKVQKKKTCNIVSLAYNQKSKLSFISCFLYCNKVINVEMGFSIRKD